MQSHRHGLDVSMERGSIMERVYGDGEVRVNSMHHMAIDEVAPGFAVTARCPMGWSKRLRVASKAGQRLALSFTQSPIQLPPWTYGFSKSSLLPSKSRQHCFARG